MVVVLLVGAVVVVCLLMLFVGNPFVVLLGLARVGGVCLIGDLGALLLVTSRRKHILDN